MAELSGISSSTSATALLAFDSIGWTRLGGYVASAWLLAIALNLVTMGQFFDIAVRDVGLSIAAFTLARLAEVREPAAAREVLRAPADRPIRTRA